MLKIYLVGGAVRDRLMGRTVKERDFVVIGTTVEEMLKLGFKPVGKDFPVFLHPKTGEEYALARTERKISKGYKGFEFYADKNITLEEDLIRRDLTINAMAEDENGQIIDPFAGQKDLEKKVLRHISKAFTEDPVRILRVARFAAKLDGFKVASETIKLMKTMVDSGEVDALVPERVFKELHRALEEDYPERFFEVLRKCGALKRIFPQIDALFGVPNPVHYHPEIDSGIHTLLALKQGVILGDHDSVINFAILAHDLGKIKSPKEDLPKHHGHEENGLPLVKQLCKQLRVPTQYKELAILTTKYHGLCHTAQELKPSTLLKLLQALDPFRRPKRFKQFLIACEADSKGRLGHENEPYPQAEYMIKMYQACAKINIQSLIKDVAPNKIPEVIYNERLKVIKALKKELSGKEVSEGIRIEGLKD